MDTGRDQFPFGELKPALEVFQDILGDRIADLSPLATSSDEWSFGAAVGDGELHISWSHFSDDNRKISAYLFSRMHGKRAALQSLDNELLEASLCIAEAARNAILEMYSPSDNGPDGRFPATGNRDHRERQQPTRLPAFTRVVIDVEIAQTRVRVDEYGRNVPLTPKTLRTATIKFSTERLIRNDWTNIGSLTRSGMLVVGRPLAFPRAAQSFGRYGIRWSTR